MLSERQINPPYQGYIAISRLLCHTTATLPYQGYFAIARLFCHITATLPYHGYSAIPRLFCHIKVTLPYHGYFAIPRLLCHSKAILPYQSYFAISRLLYHIKATVPPTVKAKPTKNFSSKRKLPYHKICRSACFSPPPFFLFKACTFYPCVSYFIYFHPC